jgi:crossover junction endodeoxyribonuclease RuvC
MKAPKVNNLRSGPGDAEKGVRLGRAARSASFEATPGPRPTRVLAIDPGYDRLGIAVLEGDASKPELVWSACIEPEKGSPPHRLAAVYAAVASAITTYEPELLAIETLFFSTNKKTAIGVAEARGAVLAAAGAAKLAVLECSPQQVKLAVTGYGGADKAAVARMVPRLLRLAPRKRKDDELDAIALGIAALAQKITFAQIVSPGHVTPRG